MPSSNLSELGKLLHKVGVCVCSLFKPVTDRFSGFAVKAVSLVKAKVICIDTSH